MDERKAQQPLSQRFRLARRLGAGGMGEVFEAVDRSSGRTVALKTLRLLSADGLLLFKNEFRSLEAIRHPNLVGLGELIEEGGRWFFTMDLIDGVPVSTWVRPCSPQADEATLPAAATPALDTDGVTQPITGDAGAIEPDGAAPIGSAFDEARLRSALGQLAAGLSALHRHGKVHRDIKPSNVLVRPDGRLVILDFGMVTESAADPGDGELAAELMGTPGYMAPEQAAGRPVGPSADWYAVGVILYRALAGRLPFLGNLAQIIEQKLKREPPPPSQFAGELPADLEQLCLALLARDPADRAGPAEIRRVAGAVAEPEVGAPPPVDTFLGREAELARLDRAFDELRDHGPRCIDVRGASGVGKSALVDAWLGRLAAREPEAVVLAGRCYERESVPYKAVDGIVDALARALAAADDGDVRELLPERCGVLAGVFPALGAVGGIAEAAASERPIVDPAQRRRELFAALRTLLTRLSWRAPLVLSIDDLQWADEDSLALASELLRPPAGVRALLLVTQRAESALELDRLRVPVERLELGGLADADARALAAALVGGDGNPDAIAREAAGHPLFIAELARAPSTDGGATLEQVLWRRIGPLPPARRELLAALSVAGAPIPQQVAGEAAGVDRLELADEMAALRGDRLIRTGGAEPEAPAEPYHGRVRDAVLDHLGSAAKRTIHGRLAAALERQAAPDPEALAVHFRGAGDRERAARFAERAADRAAAALAFERAVRLYRDALDDGADRGEVRRKLGDALANAGRGAEAARELLAAAESATTSERLELERRAAEQLLRAGHVDDGLSALVSVLRKVGYRLPKSSGRAIPALLLERARLRTRGLSFRERPPAAIDPDSAARMDVAWSAAVGLAMIDAVRGAIFQTRLLLAALGAGEPYRAALALSLEAAYQAADGTKGSRRTEMTVDRARTLAEKTGEPHAIGLSIGAAAMAAYLCGRFADALELAQKSDAIFRDHCFGCAWERGIAQIVAAWARVYLGDFPGLERTVPAQVRDAEARGDRFRATGLRTGTLVAAPLSRDDPAAARAEVADAMRDWSHDSFLHQHWDQLLAECEIDLYEGDGRAALSRLDARWPELRRAMVLLIQVSRIEALFLRGRAALIAAAEGGADADRLRARARRDARKLRAEGCPWATGLGLTVAACVAWAEDRGDDAASLLDDAGASFAAADMAVHAAAVRRARGVAIGGDQGRALIDRADELLRGRGIAAPARYAASLVPGF